jgi:hypothetical protein
MPLGKMAVIEHQLANAAVLSQSPYDLSLLNH